MRVAIDSSLLLDVFLNDPQHADSSLALLERHAAQGALIICPVAYSEIAAVFAPCSRFQSIAHEMGIVLDPISVEVAELAAQMWRDYRRRGGPRKRVLPDFLIGAHAQLKADGLLTRDRGYFRDYFQGLKVIGPLST